MNVAIEVSKFVGVIGAEVCGLFLFIALLDCLHAVTAAAKAHAKFFGNPINININSYWHDWNNRA